MRKTILLVTVVTTIIIMTVVSCDNIHVKTETKDSVNDDNPEKRGEYLVNIMGCDDCHSPKKFGANGPEIDTELRLSGYPSERPLPVVANTVTKDWLLFSGDLTAAIGPWGTSYSANITSDDTGIGKWTEEQFKKALTQGKFKGLDNTRQLLPPMPWPNYRNMKEEDVKAIYTFLKSTKPVKNIVPAAVPPGGAVPG